MAVSEFRLQQLVVAILKQGPTAAGARVYSPGDWGTWDQQYPALLIRVMEDDKESLGRNAPQFNTVSTIRVEVRIDAPEIQGAPAGAGAIAAEHNAWVLKRQVEKLVINNGQIMPVIQQFTRVRSQMAFSSEGEKHFVLVACDFHIEHYQGPAAFYEQGIEPLDEIDIFFQPPPPGTPPDQPTLAIKIIQEEP